MTGNPIRLTATGSQTVGPFFHIGLASNPQLGRLVYPETPGERIRLRVRVTDGRDEPVPDALVELWQADAAGNYVGAGANRDGDSPRFCGYGRLPTDQDGACEFETIIPGRVSPPDSVRQAPHVHVCLFMRGLLRPLYTRAYFEGDPTLPEDPVMALVPPDRQSTLLARLVDGDNGHWRFDVHLQGQQETVFFDL